jgi:hypothetical protein
MITPAVENIHRVQVEFKGSHDAEIAGPAAERPEEVLVFRGACDHEVPVGSHHVSGPEVVARQPVLPGEVADAAAQSEPRNACRSDDAARGGQTEDTCCVIEVRPRRTRFGPCCSIRRIHSHSPAAREVDDEAAVAGPEPGRAVAPAAQGQVQGCITCEIDAAITSATCETRRMAAGRLSIIPLKTARASS